MWLKGLKNNNKKNCMILDFGFEALCWGEIIIIIIIIINMNWYFHQVNFLKDIGMYPKVSKTSASMHDNKILHMILSSQNCNNCKCHLKPCKEKRCNIN